MNEGVLQSVQMWIMMGGLGILSIEDLKWKKLHSLPIAAIGIIGIVFSVITDAWMHGGWWLGWIPGILVLFFAWLTKESIGYGDGLVILSMGGFYSAVELCSVLLLAVTIAGVGALILLVFFRKNRKTQLAFVPFLLCAHLLAGVLGGTFV